MHVGGSFGIRLGDFGREGINERNSNIPGRGCVLGKARQVVAFRTRRLHDLVRCKRRNNAERGLRAGERRFEIELRCSRARSSKMARMAALEIKGVVIAEIVGRRVQARLSRGRRK
jgi:hypothetical protein